MLSTPPRGDAVSVDYGIKLMNLPTRTFTLLFQYTYNRTRSTLRVDKHLGKTQSLEIRFTTWKVVRQARSR